MVRLKKTAFLYQGKDTFKIFTVFYRLYVKLKLYVFYYHEGKIYYLIVYTYCSIQYYYLNGINNFLTFGRKTPLKS